LAFGVANVLEALAEGPHRFYEALGRLRVEDTDHWHRLLLRARRQRPRRRGATEQSDELAPFHCPVPPVLPNERNSTPWYGRGLLRCGISIWPMTAQGPN